MPNSSRAKVTGAPLVLRLGAIAASALFDQFIASLRARVDRVRDLHVAFALAREAEADAANHEQLTGVCGRSPRR